MKPFKSLSNVRLLLCASLFLASCGEQTELEQPGVTNGETVEVTKEIQISVLPMQTVGGAATRSASDKPEKGEAIGITYMDDAATRVQTGSDNMTSGESTIKNAYIVQFDGTDPTSTAAWVSSDIKGQLNSGSAISCGFTMTAGKKNRVYVVANVATAPSRGMTLTKFEKPVDYTSGTSLPGTGLPMSAMQDIGVGDVFDVFQLKSVLAKLKFTCSTAGATLKLKGVPSGYSLTKVQPSDNAVRPGGITYDNTTGIDLTSGTAYYIPENLSGRVQLSSPLVRCSLFAPSSSMFVVISGANSTTYNIYLGDSSARDFNFVGGYAYNINATLYDVSDLDWRVGAPPTATALDDNEETANCYIADASKWYSFDGTVMGNGAVTSPHTASAIPGDANFDAIVPSKLNPASAEILWESVNTATPPAKGTIVNPAVYVAKDRILFKSGSTAGNALIAAKDASDNIIWSWHIWRINDTPAAVRLATVSNNDNSFTVRAWELMDRNLGALRATPAKDIKPEEDYGLHYQWGRKDPFQTQTNPTIAAGGAITPADAVKNPTTFYKNATNWTFRNDILWGCPLTENVTIKDITYDKNGGKKSIYDPCPVGWRVMPSFTFARATASDNPWDATINGINFTSITDKNKVPFVLPAAGYRNGYNGEVHDSGSAAQYTTSSLVTTERRNNSGVLVFSKDYLLPFTASSFSVGSSVRCIGDTDIFM